MQTSHANCMDLTLFNMYVKVSLLFTSCHLNATEVVLLMLLNLGLTRFPQASLDCIMVESY